MIGFSWNQMSSSSFLAQFLASSDFPSKIPFSFSCRVASFSYFLTLCTTYMVLRMTATSDQSVACRKRSDILRFRMSKWFSLNMPGAQKISTSTSLLRARPEAAVCYLLLQTSSRKTSAKTNLFSWALASRMKYCWQPRLRSEHSLIKNQTMARSPPQEQALLWNSSKRLTMTRSRQICRKSSFDLVSSFLLGRGLTVWAGCLPTSILLSQSLRISETFWPAADSRLAMGVGSGREGFQAQILASAGFSTMTQTGFSTTTSTGFSITTYTCFSTIFSTIFQTIISLGFSYARSAIILSAYLAFSSTSACSCLSAYSAFLSLLSSRMNISSCSFSFRSSSSSLAATRFSSSSKSFFNFSKSFSSTLGVSLGFSTSFGFSTYLGLVGSTRSSNLPRSNSPRLMKPRVVIQSMLLQGLLPVYLKSISLSMVTIQLHFSLQLRAQKQCMSSSVVSLKPAGIISSSFRRQDLQLSTSRRSMKSVTSFMVRLVKTKRKFMVSTAQRYYHSCRNLVRLQMGPSRSLCACNSDATVAASIELNKINTIQEAVSPYAEGGSGGV